MVRSGLQFDHGTGRSRSARDQRPVSTEKTQSFKIIPLGEGFRYSGYGVLDFCGIAYYTFAIGHGSTLGAQFLGLLDRLRHLRN